MSIRGPVGLAALACFTCLSSVGSWAGTVLSGDIFATGPNTAEMAGRSVSHEAFIEKVILRTSDIQAGDRVSFSVAISGDLVVVGAFGEDGGNGDPLSSAGAAYLFERDAGGGDAWGEVKKLVASDAQADDWFGYKVAVDGDTVIVGARWEDGGVGDPSSKAGAAYVYQRDYGGVDNWGEVKKLVASDAQVDDTFGGTLSISGTTVVVGASGEDGGPGDPISSAGAAYVFERDFGGANNWGEVKKLMASDAQVVDGFSTQISISGDIVVIGAMTEDGGAGDPLADAGAAYVFGRNHGGASNWGEVKKLTASDAQTGDQFGRSVAVSGGTAVVTARFEDGGPGDPISNAGAAYIFERNLGGTDNWGGARKPMTSDAQPDDMLSEVSIDGDTVVVGMISEDGGPGDPLNRAGAAYAFRRNLGGTDNWGEIAKLTASDAQADDFFAGEVGISGGTVVVSASGEDGGPGDPLNYAGAAYIFLRNPIAIFKASLPPEGFLLHHLPLAGGTR